MDRDRPSGGTEPPPAGAPSGLVTSVTCPGCGVSVAVGYPKCPKCHSPVPQPQRRSKRATAREELMSGGTSVEPEASGGYGGLLAVAAIVLVGIGAMVLLMARDDDAPAGEAAADTDEPGEDDDDGAGGEDDDVDDEPVADPPRPPPADSPLEDAIKGLDAALRTDRVWSKVGVDGTTIVVESALCADPSMMPILNDQLGALRAGGATAIRCQEPHGGVVFTTDL